MCQCEAADYHSMFTLLQFQTLASKAIKNCVKRLLNSFEWSLDLGEVLELSEIFLGRNYVQDKTRPHSNVTSKRINLIEFVHKIFTLVQFQDLASKAIKKLHKKTPKFI